MIRCDGLIELIDSNDEIRASAWALDPCTREFVLLQSPERYSDPVDFTSLPRVPGYTGRTVRKWCSRTLGISATRLRKRVVVERTFEMLADDPHTSLEWLATRVGYARYSALSRVWSTVVGISPSFAAGALQRNPPHNRLDDRIRAAARIVDAEVDRRSRGGARGGPSDAP